MAAVPLTSFNKLNGQNYTTWAEKIKCHLITLELWDTVSALPAADDERAIQRDCKARAYIILALEDSQLIHVKHLATSHEVWECLQNLYQRPSAMSKVVIC